MISRNAAVWVLLPLLLLGCATTGPQAPSESKSRFAQLLSATTQEEFIDEWNKAWPPLSYAKRLDDKTIVIAVIRADFARDMQRFHARQIRTLGFDRIVYTINDTIITQFRWDSQIGAWK